MNRVYTERYFLCRLENPPFIPNFFPGETYFSNFPTLFRQCSGGYQANQTNHPPANGITRVKSTCDQCDDPPILLLHSCILNLCDSYHPILIVNNYHLSGESHFISRLSKTHEHFAGKTTHLLFEKHHISRVKLVKPPRGFTQGTRNTATPRISTWRTGSSRLRHRRKGEARFRSCCHPVESYI